MVDVMQKLHVLELKSRTKEQTEQNCLGVYLVQEPHHGNIVENLDGIYRCQNCDSLFCEHVRLAKLYVEITDAEAELKDA